MEQRDPYLRSMIRFRSIAIKRTMNKFQETTKKKGINPNLPNSFIPMSTFDRDDIENNKRKDDNFCRSHKHMFEKFANYRKALKLKLSDDEYLTKIFLPDKDLFMHEIIPVFSTHISHMMPFLDMKMLQHEINVLYDRVEKNHKIDIKKFDHMVYSIVLLITVLVQISIKFQKGSVSLFQKILDVDSTKYIGIVNHFLFQMKVLRKCTLLQLYCLVLIRFYHWCAPEDGDGTEAQNNRILMGTIIASAKEMGINWSCFGSDKYFFKVAEGTRPNLGVMKPNDYEETFKSLWAVILFWDRKMGFINGQECMIAKTFPVDPKLLINSSSWYMRVMYIDSILLKINNIIIDEPSNVNINVLEAYYEQLCNEFMNLKASNNTTPFQFANPLDFEFEWMLDLFKLSITQAKMMSYETNLNIVKYHEAAQQLWDQIILIAQKCYIYFYDTNKLNINPFNRFFTNRIVEIVANKLCVLTPSFILRFSRMNQSYETRKLVCKFLFAVSSMYFNEFSADYYKCFRKMFTAKLSYKILDRPADRDPWEIILRFLVSELKERRESGQDDDPDVEETRLADLVPLVNKLSINYDNEKSLRNCTDFVKRWNEEIYPICKFDTKFHINFREDIMKLFMDDKYPAGLNLFASFYDNTSFKLSENIDNSIKHKHGDIHVHGIIPRLPAALVGGSPGFDTSSMSTSSGHSIPGRGTAGTSPQVSNFNVGDTAYNDLFSGPLGNLDMLDDIFDPLDFISYFN